MISKNVKSLNLDNIKGLNNLSDSQAETLTGGFSFHQISLQATQFEQSVGRHKSHHQKAKSIFS